VLTSALKTAGVDREHIRIDNLVPLQPPGNKWEAHRPEDVAWGQQRLLALLATHKPRMIVALGNEVGRFLLGDRWPEGEGIQDVRGYLWDTPHGRVLTSVHPAAILRDWTPWRALLDVDLRRAVNEWREDCPPLDTHKVRVVASRGDEEEMREELSRDESAHGLLGRAGAGRRQRQLSLDPQRSVPGAGGSGAGGVGRRGGEKKPQRAEQRLPVRHVRADPGVASQWHPGVASQWLAVDIENTERRELACVAFAANTTKAWVVPATQGWQLTLIKELCESSAPKVLQNGQYDRFFLRRFAGIALRAQAFDTMLAWHALQPELAGRKMQTRKRAYGRRSVKSLKFLASIYTRVPWWKEYAFQNEGERYELCGRDACVTLDVARKQAKQLEAGPS
jgi:uracil-DNA glycosylase family 4